MKIVSPQEMSSIDKETITCIGIPQVVLMENAAQSVLQILLQRFGPLNGKSFVVLAGKGSNGGDAFALSRHLHNQAANVTVFFTGTEKALEGGSQTNYHILKKMGMSIHEGISPDFFTSLEAQLQACDCIIDGLFGTGLNRCVAGTDQKVMQSVAARPSTLGSKRSMLISLDIPSGIHGDTGQVMGAALKADLTVCFGLLKQGVVIHPGNAHAGEIVVTDISIPPAVIAKRELKGNYTTVAAVQSFLPKRKQESHKGSYGRVLVITGSQGMTGAGYLAGMAVLRSGAGLCYLAVPKSLQAIYAVNAPECVLYPLEDTDGVFRPEAKEKLLEVLPGMDTVVFGPGVSRADHLRGLLAGILENTTAPVIIDADGLNLLSSQPDLLKKKRGPVLLTPHEGEMARLLQGELSALQQNRIHTVLAFAQEHQVMLLLKGNRSIVAAPWGEFWVNSSGNSALATAGSGDVLAGIMGGFVAAAVCDMQQDATGYPQGFGTEAGIFQQAVAAAFVHGLAGELAAKEKGEHGTLASDLLHKIPDAIQRILLKKFSNADIFEIMSAGDFPGNLYKRS